MLCMVLAIPRYIKPGVWPGWQCAHFTRERVLEFARLYVPAALSTASSFWRSLCLRRMGMKAGARGWSGAMSSAESWSGSGIPRYLDTNEAK